MRKIKSKKNIATIQSLSEVIPNGYNEPLSKRKIRELLYYHGWDKDKVLRLIQTGEFVYHFMKD